MQPPRKLSQKESDLGSQLLLTKFSTLQASFILHRKNSLEATECEECHAQPKNAPKGAPTFVGQGSMQKRLGVKAVKVIHEETLG